MSTATAQQKRLDETNHALRQWGLATPRKQSKVALAQLRALVEAIPEQARDGLRWPARWVDCPRILGTLFAAGVPVDGYALPPLYTRPVHQSRLTELRYYALIRSAPMASHALLSAAGLPEWGQEEFKDLGVGLLLDFETRLPTWRYLWEQFMPQIQAGLTSSNAPLGYALLNRWSTQPKPSTAALIAHLAHWADWTPAAVEAVYAKLLKPGLPPTRPQWARRDALMQVIVEHRREALAVSLPESLLENTARASRLRF